MMSGQLEKNNYKINKKLHYEENCNYRTRIDGTGDILSAATATRGKSGTDSGPSSQEVTLAVS